MPLYEYYCKRCDRVIDVVVRLSELDLPQQCRLCSKEMTRQMSAPHIQMDYPGYVCPVSGKYVEGRRAHKENLEKHGCRVLEPGEKEHKERLRAEADKELDRRIEKTVGETIHAMPPEKQRKLTTELEHGASAAVVRQ